MVYSTVLLLGHDHSGHISECRCRFFFSVVNSSHRWASKQMCVRFALHFGRLLHTLNQLQHKGLMCFNQWERSTCHYILCMGSVPRSASSLMKKCLSQGDTASRVTGHEHCEDLKPHGILLAFFALYLSDFTAYWRKPTELVPISVLFVFFLLTNLRWSCTDITTPRGGAVSFTASVNTNTAEEVAEPLVNWPGFLLSLFSCVNRQKSTFICSLSQYNCLLLTVSWPTVICWMTPQLRT